MTLDVFGASYSRAYDINNQGQAVGMYYAADGSTHAFLWQNNIAIDLGSFGEDTEARAINELGQVVMNARISGVSHAFLVSGDQIIDLGAGTLAYGINDLGQVVGAWTVSDGNGTPTNPVPEPATMLLVASGLVGLAGLRKRFRKGECMKKYILLLFVGLFLFSTNTHADLFDGLVAYYSC
jgi:probable HAF family extracellular repeat protein